MRKDVLFFVDVTFHLGKYFTVSPLEGANFYKILPIFTYNQGKIFLNFT